MKNPAADFMPENDGNAATGYAMLVELAPGIHPAAHAAVVSSFQQYQQVLRAHGMKYAVVEIVSKTVIQDVILQQVAADLIHGEIAGLPIALLLMILVFGGILAAGLPLAGALTAIGIAMGLIWSITFVTNVDSFVLNILSITGLALSIDYGLLVVSRYREIIQGKLGQIAFTPAELKQRKTQIMPLIRDAVSETVLTAGRTVSFSAITIAVSIAGLFLIKAPMIQIIGTGGVLVTLFAVLTAVTLVPACIVLLGIRLLQPSPLSRIPGISFLFRHLGDASEKRGIFSALAAWVHARPWRVLIAVTAILMISAMPIKDLRMRSNFVEYVPQDTPVAAAMEEIKTHYPLFQTPDITIYAETTSANTSDLIAEIQEMDHVQRVSEPNNFDSGVNISIYTDAADAVGKEVTDLVHQIRALDLGFPVYVGGSAAMQLDFTQAIIAGAPAAAIVIISAVFVLLFLLTGSLIVPLKALLINTLSLVSSTGIALFIFENGLFGMPVSHGLETFVVACAAAFGFGLAMDYEVFLIARIKEYWDLGMSNDAAVERGLQQSGRIITAAAAIIIAVFIGFSLGELMPVKQIGVVLAVIVFVDATLVRMLLVPSLMTLMGKWNWWAPKPLLKFYEKFKLVH
ncbi:MMPL family transporter [Arcanobacterium hippocoleae]|uniref:MMPL family transporter n=1 Tax=Arcanobacterium hippocoleae TaxID=149017 RepID=UPI0033424EA5